MILPESKSAKQTRHGGEVMKYTVLVAEDEYNLRRAFIEKVEWEKAGFEVVGEAENGAEALEAVETLKPDLIITDIRMPLISGLELASRVRVMRPATQIVILSGYDSFEYARTAIDYNIISYLLKPISSAEFSSELFTIRKRMDERLEGLLERSAGESAELKKVEFLMSLMLGGTERQVGEESELKSKAEALGIIEAGVKCRFAVLVSKFKDEGAKSESDVRFGYADFIDNIMRRYMNTETIIAYGRAVTLAVLEERESGENELEIALTELVQTSERVLGKHCTVGVSREFDKFTDCPGAYFQAITARRYTSDGAGQVRFISDRERDGEIGFEYVERMSARVEQLLKLGSAQGVSEFIGEIYAENTPENANLLVVQLIATVCRVVSNVSDKSELSKLVDKNPIFARITSYSSESGMKSELENFCLDAKRIVEQSQKRESQVLCDRVIDIISERYPDAELSLAGVSRELAVSPNYLSALIKKETKKNFTTLLTDKRMKAAHDMLMCTSAMVLEVSEKCGYSDQHYFSYCFKKYYGESPNRVRSGAKTGE